MGIVLVSCPLGFFFPVKYQASFLKRIFLNVALSVLVMLVNKVGEILMTVEAGGQGHEGSLYYSTFMYVSRFP